MAKSKHIKDYTPFFAAAPRFFQKIAVNDGSGDTCWQWIGAKRALGYGKIKICGRWFPAHRLAWILCYKSIDENLDIDHLCENKSCVNPAHLDLVTSKVNVMRTNNLGSNRGYYGLRTHCKYGHPFSTENTRITFNPYRRRCRTCQRLEKRRQLAERMS
jgi:hypothetical protein